MVGFVRLINYGFLINALKALVYYLGRQIYDNLRDYAIK